MCGGGGTYHGMGGIPKSRSHAGLVDIGIESAQMMITDHRPTTSKVARFCDPKHVDVIYIWTEIGRHFVDNTHFSKDRNHCGQLASGSHEWLAVT